MAVWRWLVSGLVILLCLVACTAVPDPTPTPVQDVAEVATVVVERPSATPPPTLTATSQPTVTPEPMATEEMITATAVPTSTPIPSPTPNPNLSIISQSELNELLNPISDNEAQRPFVQDGVLLKETAEVSGGFEELGYVKTAVWSPDGSKMIYNLTDTPNTFDNPATEYEQWLWSTEDGTLVSLADLMPDYPNPAYHVFNMFWSPDSTKIVFEASLDERHEEERLYQTDYLLVTADLNRGIVHNPHFITGKQQPAWLTNEAYIIRFHCGTSCGIYSAYDYSGKLVWTQDFRTGSSALFSLANNFMITIGRYPDEPNASLPPSTVDEINLSTGELKTLWERPPTLEDEHFNPFLEPELSPDEQFVTFNYGSPNTLYVIDRDGRELGQYPNSSFVDWRPNGGLTIKHELDSGVSQLEHLSETWELQIIFTTEPNTLITNSPWMNGGGKWSPDGRYFIFTTENYDNDKTQLYLWLPEEKQVRLIPTQEQDFSDPIWLPDSTAFYFIINGTIWEYGIATAD